MKVSSRSKFDNFYISGLSCYSFLYWFYLLLYYMIKKFYLIYILYINILHFKISNIVWKFLCCLTTVVKIFCENKSWNVRRGKNILSTRSLFQYSEKLIYFLSNSGNCVCRIGSAHSKTYIFPWMEAMAIIYPHNICWFDDCRLFYHNIFQCQFAYVGGSMVTKKSGLTRLTHWVILIHSK